MSRGGRHQVGGILDGLYSEHLLPEINVSNIADDLHISGYLPAFLYLMGRDLPAHEATRISFSVNVAGR